MASLEFITARSFKKQRRSTRDIILLKLTLAGNQA